MSSKLKSYRIEDIASEMGDAPFGSNLKNDDYRDSGALVVQGKNIQGRNCDWSDRRYISYEKYEQLHRSQCFPGDIVFPKVGTIGKVGLLTRAPGIDHYVLSTNTMKLRVNDKIACTDFVYYYFTIPRTVALIHAFNSKSVQPVFNFSALKKFQILLPPIEEQLKVSGLLRSLDDRITLLRETNATLEAIAQALFKSWFVDFDPVRTKMEGREPEGMNAETAALFPDSFEESELGLVPSGWLVRGISQTCELGRGSSPRPIQNFMGSDVPWIKIADATASEGMFVFETKEKIIHAGVKNSVKVKPGDLIMSNSASCGITVFVELNGCVHDGWLYFKNYQHITKSFLFFWLRKIANHLVNIADGTVQKNLNIAMVSSQKIICPPENVLLAFESIVDSLLGRIRENCIQAQTLANLRDTLLPRLISGQLRLPEAQEELNEELA